jgi:hypothetical protein
MSKSEEKFSGNYVDIVCDPGSIDTESFGSILTKIDDNGYACVDCGYGVKLEHIINIKQSDGHLEE